MTMMMVTMIYAQQEIFGYKSVYFKGFVFLWAVLCTKTIVIRLSKNVLFFCFYLYGV